MAPYFRRPFLIISLFFTLLKDGHWFTQQPPSVFFSRTWKSPERRSSAAPGRNARRKGPANIAAPSVSEGAGETATFFFLAKKLEFSVLKPMEPRSFFCLEGCCLKHTVVGKTCGRILVFIFHSSHHGRGRSRVDHFNFVKKKYINIIRSTWGWLYIYIYYNRYVIYHYIPTFCQVCLSKQHTIHGGNLTPWRSSKEGVLNHNFGSIGRSQVWKISPWPLSRYAMVKYMVKSHDSGEIAKDMWPTSVQVPIYWLWPCGNMGLELSILMTGFFGLDSYDCQTTLLEAAIFHCVWRFHGCGDALGGQISSAGWGKSIQCCLLDICRNKRYPKVMK